MANKQGVPRGVVLIGTCGKCNEALEIPLTRKEAKKLRKRFKGITRPNQAFGTKIKCNHCQAELDFTIDKKEIENIWQGMQQPTIHDANKKGDELWLKQQAMAGGKT